MLRMVLIVDLWMLLQTENGLQLQLQGTGLGKRLLCLMAIAWRNAVATERYGALLQRSAVAAGAIWLQWRPHGVSLETLHGHPRAPAVSEGGREGCRRQGEGESKEKGETLKEQEAAKG